MKKVILFVIAFIPTLVSCNNNGNGFPNPFPEDTYPRIGFNIVEEEMVKDPLPSQEATLIDNTYAHLSDYNELITKVEGQVHERNYERAFAGVFEQGYSISNRMSDKEFSTIRVSSTNEDPTYEIRQITNTGTKSVVDYSYGKSEVNSNTKTYRYLAKKDPNTNEFGPGTYSEVATSTEAGFVLEQTLELYGSEKSMIDVQCLQEKPSEANDEPWYDKTDFVIPMTDYFFPTTEATTIPGVTKSGEVVLVKESHLPYKKEGYEEGIYELQDGRQYRAMVNSIMVTRLTPVKATDETPDWYIVSHVRKYSETAITSDVIQPNVPISYLTNPIVISYTEEKYQFFKDMQTNKETIEEVVIK